MSLGVMHAMLSFMRNNVCARSICFLALCLVLPLLPSPARADCSFFQISLSSDAQLVSKKKEICGVRLDLPWGENKTVQGIDVGLVNNAGGLRGIEAGGLVNMLKGAEEAPSLSSGGLQLAGLVNSNRRVPFTGIQVAGLANDHDGASFSGLQLAGVLNDNDETVMQGIQLALFSNQNYEGEVDGIQVALFNQAQKLTGLQIGLGNGVSAAEGAVAAVEIPFDIMLGLLGAHTGLPFYEDPRAHQDAAATGIQIAATANLTEYLTGIQISPFFNKAGQSSKGAQVALIANDAGDMEGVQLAGSANIAEGSASGLQAGILNVVEKDFSGFQVGAINFTKADATGVEIGFVNVCKNLNGLQIGAINVVWGRFPNSIFFAPIINAGF